MRASGLWAECGLVVLLAAASVRAQDPPYAESEPDTGTEPAPAPAPSSQPSSAPPPGAAPQPTQPVPPPSGQPGYPPSSGQPGQPPPAQPGQPPPAQPGQPPPAQPGQPPPGQPGAQPPGYGYPPPYGTPPPGNAYPSPGYGYPPAGYGYPPPGQPPPEPPLPAPEPFPTRDFSLTISPLHLFIFPVLELTGELRLVDHFGVALVAGYGQATAEDELGDEFTFDVYEIGGQANWYLLKPFRSLHLGVEVDYMKITTDELRNNTLSGVGVGLAVGPLVGYKVMSRGGFTFNVQGGVQYVAVSAEVRDSEGETDSASDSDFVLLLNLGLGWSF